MQNSEFQKTGDSPFSTFQTLASALNKKAEHKGTMEGYAFHVVLPGKSKIGELDAIAQLVNSFNEMTPHEQWDQIDTLEKCLKNVTLSPHFNSAIKSLAQESLDMTPLWRLGSRDVISSISIPLLTPRTRITFSDALKKVLENPESGGEDVVELLNYYASQGVKDRALLDEGKLISKTWKAKDGNAAVETIERKDTVESLQINAEKELRFIQSRLESPLEQREREKLERKAAHLEKIIDQCQKREIKWTDSDYFRDMLRGDPSLSSAENAEDLQGTILAWEMKMEEEYLSLSPAVNMRYHTCTIDEETEGFLRLGVISDMSNGFVHLSALEDLNSSFLNNDLITANALRSSMAQEIVEVWKNSLKEEKKNIDASAGYALKQLGYSIEEIEAIKRAIINKTPIDNLLSLSEEKLPYVREVLKNTIEKRVEVMERQFLQMVTDHATRLNSDDMNQGMMKMLHVCLLNQKVKRIDGSGWYHNEENEMLDMNALFERFDGKMLIADAKGPFIDEKGNIHVPPSEVFQEGQEIVLRAIFTNQSVQGYTKNKGVQREINERALAKLRDLHLDNNEIEEILTGKKTGFTSAADSVHFAIKKGFKTSTGCLSAKDRTGLVSALQTDRMMRDKQFSTSSRRRFLRSQLKKNSPAVLVIKDNTGCHIMKIKPFRIEGITKDTYNIKSWVVRSSVYVRQGVEMLKEKKRIQRKERERLQYYENRRQLHS